MTPPPSSSPDKEARAKRIVNEALRARVTIALSGLAVLAAILALATSDASASTVGSVLGIGALVVVLAQLLARSYLMQLEQEAIVQKTDEAADKLLVIQRTTEEELRAEYQQSERLELLFTAMREFNLIQVKSLDALRESRPTTSFYLQRHSGAIVDVLGGRWDRSELLRPSQLWREYGELVTRMRNGETFRSTVCMPSNPALLFDDEEFNKYAEAIYAAAASPGIQVKRLFVLNGKKWPGDDTEQLEEKTLEHLRKVGEVENSTEAFRARVTLHETARRAFRSQLDFMIWDDGLLIDSDLESDDGLVNQADFYFASTKHTAEIVKRQEQFDQLFEDEELTRPLTSFV